MCIRETYKIVLTGSTVYVAVSNHCMNIKSTTKLQVVCRDEILADFFPVWHSESDFVKEW